MVVSQVSSAQGMQLTHLECGHSRVPDLSPLEGMPLTYLNFGNTRVLDLSPLKGMLLESLSIPEVSAENFQFIRGIESLKTINDKPAAEFWKQIDAR